MKISGWGNNININSNVLYPKNNNEIIKILKDKNIKNILCRGLGRSYGDNGLNTVMISLAKYKKKIVINSKKDLLICSANLSFKEASEELIQKGYFFHVTPGSSNVTIGGAISNDVHGKNHHVDGTFTKYIKEITLITPEGKIIKCSSQKNIKLFRATCSGAGLTGIIINVKIILMKIKSRQIDVSISVASNIKETITKLKKLKNKKYLIAWMDTINKGNFGRSIIISGTHSKNNFLKKRYIFSFKFPSILAKIFMNSFFIRIFNKIYFTINKRKKIFKQDLQNFFYPLDAVSNWNKFYGKNGFTQIQILIPEKINTLQAIKKIFTYLNKNKIYSYLTTLKEFGKSNSNYLTFPEKGITMTLDIPVTKDFILLYPNLEKILINNKIKVYLAKDSYMSENFFKKTYKNLNEFLKIKKSVDKNSKFLSLQGKRIGL